jgi:hypothetical protein
VPVTQSGAAEIKLGARKDTLVGDDDLVGLST